jgi:hypothetical protein
MRPFHPDDFVPGKKYRIKGREKVGEFTFQSFSTLEMGGRKLLYLVFEFAQDFTSGEFSNWFCPSSYPLEAEEVV